VRVGPTDGQMTYFSTDHIKVDHERQRAVPDVLEFPPRDFARPQWQAWRGPLQSLDTRHFVGAQDALSSRHARRRISIHGTHVGNPLIPLFGRLVGGGCQPVPNQVWFEIGFF
jgi:hypothetical protein